MSIEDAIRKDFSEKWERIKRLEFNIQANQEELDRLLTEVETDQFYIDNRSAEDEKFVEKVKKLKPVKGE
jgi:hypothetical protein